MTDGTASRSESVSHCGLARYLSILGGSFPPSVRARFWPISDCERGLLIEGPAHDRSSNRLAARCVSSDKRATGSRPGAFQAMSERPAHGPVRFKRRAVAERASLTLLGKARVGRVSSPGLTGRQLHNAPR